ncbi:GPI ethanolamine phosphate transferase 1 [Cylas formicarius]|uniref:GPI ethanolamine phosphate transferase 1 n=1 Tax=Cylas formicarius TaxID=197179 RepID=UPI0029586C7B|nr:GPI ethanolamine phosphate transferase 1 [Cylas formicarius]XP_060517248.1 GPI ethanolamine phosphate transferase 1 [Cylas formicarius]
MGEKVRNFASGNTQKNTIVVFGLVVHVVLLFAVVDIYFSSPLDHGMSLIKSTDNPPAKRLVLFVADGLRMEAVFGKNSDRIPFLTSVMENGGSWGTAHTRVPTESRPGHVAMLAGIYEDPSAILKGWKSNPVDFDSIINQSTNAWCWGSPDILNIFNRDRSAHIRVFTYSAELEDFGANDTSSLDGWVFRKFRSFLKNEVGACAENCHLYARQGNFYFLHLLGIDTAGHGFKPHSSEYEANIRFVDGNVENVVRHFESVFGDRSTAYVFSSDHGMTDWGSHGAGSVHETEVPVIAWGAGVKRNPRRQDVRQIDLAPLMASLIGLNIPSNSLGLVPAGYLDVPPKELAQFHISNALQLLETFNVKRLRTETNALVFVPYAGLTTSVLSDKVARLRRLQRDGQYSTVVEEGRVLMGTLVEGVEYYHNYYQYPLLVSVSVGLVEWILYLVTAGVGDASSSTTSPLSRTEKLGIAVANAFPIVLCKLQKFPLSYYVHFSFPFAMFATLYPNLHRLTAAFAYLKEDRCRKLPIYVVGIELLVFGFFNRSSFSVLGLLVGLWVFASDSLRAYTTNADKLLWACLCAVMSIFPLLPVMKTTFNVPLYILGGVAWVALFYAMAPSRSLDRNVTRCQLGCLIAAMLYGLALEKGFIAHNSRLKYASWFIATAPAASIPFVGKFVAVRLAAMFFGFAPFYLLVSSNYEVVFSAVYVACLCTWLLMEDKALKGRSSWQLLHYAEFDGYRSEPKLNADIYRRAFLFMVFIFIGFFGTGNVASLNSFDPMWVRAFLTVFSPFKMAGLILLKIAVPFLFTCCVFRAINSIGREDVTQMFCIVLLFSDSMVLQFLYLITNKGSWLDIGSSLSHFVIMEAFVTILLVLYSCAHALTTASYFAVRRN